MGNELTDAIVRLCGQINVFKKLFYLRYLLLVCFIFLSFCHFCYFRIFAYTFWL